MDQVRSVAFDEMSERGFDAVTVEQIAARSSVSASTVYRYFGTKEALVLSASRPAQLVQLLRADVGGRDDDDDDDARDGEDGGGGGDGGGRTWAESFQRSAVEVWGNDKTATVELGLILDNDPLLDAWERQLLDQRSDIAAVFATRRGKSGGAKDETRAAAAIAVLTTTLLRWHRDGGGRKSLARLLAKSFDAVRTD